MVRVTVPREMHRSSFIANVPQMIFHPVPTMLALVAFLTAYRP